MEYAAIECGEFEEPASTHNLQLNFVKYRKHKQWNVIGFDGSRFASTRPCIAIAYTKRR